MRRRPLPRAIRPLPRPFVPADRRRDVLVLPGARLRSDGGSPGLPPACQAGGRAVRHLRHRNRRHRRLRPNEPFHHRQAAGAVPAQGRVHARLGESPESSATHRAGFGFAHGNGHRPAVLPAPSARRVRLAAPRDERKGKPAASPPTDATVATSCGRPPTSPWNTTASCITAAARRWPTTQEEGTTCWREAPRWYRSRAEQCGTSSNSTRSHGFLQGAWANGFPRTESAGEKPSTSFTGC